MNKKLWGGRFNKPTDEIINKFQASINFDKRLYREDIIGSIAHAKMLSAQKIIPELDCKKIISGLEKILNDIEVGKFEFDVSLEDIHMNIEKALIEDIGEAGEKLHTARSRNDQIALDMHLYVRHQIHEIQNLILKFQSKIIEIADKNRNIIMPGYTHLQHAQPILFSHQLLAYFSMLKRDFERFEIVYDHTDIMPLGSGALAGTTLPIDREFIAKELKFSKIYSNSLDAVSDRDYLMEFLSSAAILMIHLSRLSEEIILWCSREFSFIELDDAHCTGSSMMPQKKNPDIPELVRGKTGRVIGHLMALLTTMKALPLAYNKDLQEDKEGVFDTIDNVMSSLIVIIQIVSDMKILTDNMRYAVERDFCNATDLADYLVRKSLPFRQAHRIVGEIVHYCLEHEVYLSNLRLDEFRKFSELFDEDVYESIKLETCIAARESFGGTSYKQVDHQISKAYEWLLRHLQRNSIECKK